MVVVLVLNLIGYIAEVHLVDGTAYEPYINLVNLKMVCGYQKTLVVQVLVTNGVYLKFENASDLGNDSSGNNNDFTGTYGNRPSSS